VGPGHLPRYDSRHQTSALPTVGADPILAARWLVAQTEYALTVTFGARVIGAQTALQPRGAED
jgi:hypothetical protein